MLRFSQVVNGILLYYFTGKWNSHKSDVCINQKNIAKPENPIVILFFILICISQMIFLGLTNASLRYLFSCRQKHCTIQLPFNWQHNSLDKFYSRNSICCIYSPYNPGTSKSSPCKACLDIPASLLIEQDFYVLQIHDLFPKFRKADLQFQSQIWQ